MKWIAVGEAIELSPNNLFHHRILNIHFRLTRAHTPLPLDRHWDPKSLDSKLTLFVRSHWNNICYIVIAFGQQLIFLSLTHRWRKPASMSLSSSVKQSLIGNCRTPFYLHYQTSYWVVDLCHSYSDGDSWVKYCHFPMSINVSFIILKVRVILVSKIYTFVL